MDFRQPASKAYTGEPFSLPNPGLASPASLTLGDIRLPKTPTATRAPSPASGSGSVSPASMRRSNPNSQPSSRGPSRGPSRQPSREQLSSPPTSSPLHLSSVLPSSSASSTSAFSPLFPFPATSTAPSSTGPSRTRSKSVYQFPATQAIPSPPSDSFNEQSDGSSHDLGVSPLSLGLSPIALGSQPGIRRSNSQRSGQGLLANHRMSLAGAAGLGASAGPSGRPGGNGENTDEYAQIILASRNAKMRKWKTSTGSSEGGHARSGSWAGEAGPRRGLSTFGEAELVDEADITAADGVGFGLGVGSKEFEWVDWLDEYRKMKEAKLAAEGGRVPEDREGEEAAMASLANSTSPARSESNAHCVLDSPLIIFPRPQPQSTILSRPQRQESATVVAWKAFSPPILLSSISRSLRRRLHPPGISSRSRLQLPLLFLFLPNLPRHSLAPCLGARATRSRRE